MKHERDETRAERMSDAKLGMLKVFMENDISIPEGMTVISSLMIQLYYDLYPHETREEYLETMGQLFDTYKQYRMFAEATPDTIQ